MGGKKRKQILIVEDDPNIRMLLEYILRKHYEVTSREDGLSGMSWLASGNIPDLILTDVEMPRLNGYELLKNVRESGFFGKIPVIMISGFESQEVKFKCLSRGANAFLSKPFKPEEVLAKIQQLIDINYQV